MGSPLPYTIGVPPPTAKSYAYWMLLPIVYHIGDPICRADSLERKHTSYPRPWAGRFNKGQNDASRCSKLWQLVLI